MIESYTCPVCKGVQRILVDTETSKHASHMRCAYNGCKSYHIEMDSTSQEYIDNIVSKYQELLGKHYPLSLDSRQPGPETVIDVQADGSVILVDRADYLPLRLTAKQFEKYRTLSEIYESQEEIK